MTDREKMVEISKQCRADWRRSPANTDPDAMLADRLIAEGFGRVEKDIVVTDHRNGQSSIHGATLTDTMDRGKP